MSKPRMPALTAKRLRGLNKVLKAISTLPTDRDTDVLSAMEWLHAFVQAKNTARHDRLAQRVCRMCKIRKMNFPFTLCEPCLEEQRKNDSIAQQIGYVPE